MCFRAVNVKNTRRDIHTRNPGRACELGGQGRESGGGGAVTCDNPSGSNRGDVEDVRKLGSRNRKRRREKVDAVDGADRDQQAGGGSKTLKGYKGSEGNVCTLHSFSSTDVRRFRRHNDY